MSVIKLYTIHVCCVCAILIAILNNIRSYYNGLIYYWRAKEKVEIRKKKCHLILPEQRHFYPTFINKEL
jgi:hypothetical protein